ncbi:MAG: AAA family ATPase, partial [Chloroflexota bacterium]
KRLKERHDTLKAATQIASEEAKKAIEVTKKAKAEAAKAEAELPRLIREKQALEIVISELNAQKAILEREIVGLEEKLGSPREDGEDGAYADLLKEPPRCLERGLLPSRELPYADEEHALEEIWIGLEGAGYHFHKRVLKAFHTSLKCHDINPLTVLAGVSGTGKTLLPAAYARLMGMHSLVIAVQPRWDSPQDMFGFYNYLEKRYKATELARALIRMDPFATVEGLNEMQKCSERMLLVLLDEMNLARTEYYFSEFLSRLELRRLAGPSHSADDRQHAEIYLDTGPGRKPISFWVGQNVLFAGTMNEDESTQTLSDKVIDRANVLRFGRPAKSNADFHRQDQDGKLPAPAGYLPVKKWEGWCRPVQTTGWIGKAIEWIDDLNDALTKIGRPFGHRVRRSILTYIANYPGVDRIDYLYKEAFADQIEQKILPKLRGLDTMEGVNNAVFDDIGKVIEGTDDDTLLQAFGDARENNATGMFLWHGVTRQE